MTKTLRHFLDELGDALGTELDPENMDETLAKLGGIAKLIGASLQNTANPTQLGAGYKVNVIPGQATAHVDGRYLPGYEEEFLTDLDRILGPRVKREDVHADKALETTFDGALVDAMQTALSAEDPIARAVPYMLSAAPTPSPSPTSASAASASPRSSCRRSWTSRACSTGSTSGCRWMP